MRKLIVKLLCYLLLSSSAAYSGVGVSAGLGIPFVSQLGVNVTMGPKWSAYVGQNTLDISSGDASVKLSMPEVGISWHPFAGAFFIGLAIGQEKLEVESTDTSGESARAEVTASTTIAKLGWMWGRANGGFWFGMDLAYVSPSGGDVDIEVSNQAVVGTQEYQDVVDAGEKFGETAYTNITFARLGYLF